MGDHAPYWALPVMGMVPREHSLTSKPVQACGTAFTIGGGAYLTAGHVWESVQAHPIQALGMIDVANGQFLYRKIRRAESLLPAYDLAILNAPPFGKTFKWTTEPLGLLDEVRAFGYPHAFDPESEEIGVRAFRGEIVGGHILTRFSGRPAGLELSFPCPRGLSGAALISSVPERWRIVGVILGNEITEMEVYREEEKEVEGGKEKVFTKTEALHLGVAIRADAVLKIHSALLGCTIGDWVERHGLL